MKRAALALVAGLCVTSVSIVSEALGSGATQGPRPRRPTASGMRSGRMVGRYLCAQGWTALTLEVTASGSSVQAVFDFHHTPTGVRGRYSMRGQLRAGGELELAPVAWITQPRGYKMVGMRGRVGADGAYRGVILNPSCGEFFVVPS